jgi:uncharacterized protein (TIGR02452 family)
LFIGTGTIRQNPVWYIKSFKELHRNSLILISMKPQDEIPFEEQGRNPHIKYFPCTDSPGMAETCRRELYLTRFEASGLGRSAVEAAENGYYINEAGVKVNWSEMVKTAVASKRSIPPEKILPEHPSFSFPETSVRVTNETTLMAGRRMVESGLKPLALNFANGIQPGGGFLSGARAQEEAICRSSCLYHTLRGDPMYAEHAKRPYPDSTGWAILSPDVPVFRTDGGKPLDKPWLLSFITCAAPYAPVIGQPQSRLLLKKRIHRILAIAAAYNYNTLILGAWGCGAFGNDPQTTALDFREAIENDFRGAFSGIVFAITDWSPERKFLTPFCVVLSPE